MDSLGLIIGIVLFAIVGIFALVGAGIGFMRTLIRMLFSSVICLVAAALLVVLVVSTIEIIDGQTLYAYVVDMLPADLFFGDGFLAFLTNPMLDSAIEFGGLVDNTILAFILIAVELIVVYIVCRFLFYILKICVIRFIRPVRSKTIDYVLGIAFWGVIGAAIAIGIVQLANADIEFVNDLGVLDFVGEDNLFTTIHGWLETLLGWFGLEEIISIG